MAIHELVQAVWGDQPPRNARNLLQGCVSRLRRQLADEEAQGSAIVTEPHAYRLRVDSGNVDLQQFRRLRDDARAAAEHGQLAEARDRFRAALALWRGHALAGIDSRAVRQVALALDEERIQAQEECIHVELDLGGAGDLVAELADLTRLHPYRESVHAALMLALFRAGRQADALAAYRRVRKVLHDDLGVEPGSELQQLHTAVLNRASELAAPTKRAATPVVPRELPGDVAGFTGRAGVLRTLDELLTDGSVAAPAVVVSAIAGTAGVGKTALAVHWAHRIAHRFPDGQLYLNLRGYASKAPVRPIEALTALLRSTGVPPEQVPTDEMSAERLYRSQLADRRMLVVLDNVKSADQVRPLLPGSPGCLVLVTSRDRLSGLVARDGAQRLTLDVLTGDESRDLLTRLLGADRVRQEPEAVDQLAMLCAQLPLALRVAAANLADRPAHTIAAYVAELTTQDRLASLQVVGDQNSAVRATLDLSYRQLPAGTRHLFRMLGLVPGPDFTPAAAAALIGTTQDDGAQRLRQLADAHLIEEHAAGRYTFHDLLRLYARQLASAEDGDDLRAAAVRRLFGYYLHATGAATELTSPQQLRLPLPAADPTLPMLEFSQLDDALDWLDAERTNLVAVIERAAGSGPRSVAWLLASCLRTYFWSRRYNVDWLTIANTALEAARHEGHARAEAIALLNLANLHQVEGQNTRAAGLLQAALDLARRAGWVECQVALLSSMSVSWWFQGELRPAAECAADALDLSRRSGRPDVAATILNNLCGIERESGRLEHAAAYGTEALTIFRELGHPSEGDALHNLGEVCLELGRYHEAREHLTAAVSIQRRTGDHAAESISLAALAAVDRDAGNLAEATDQANASVALATGIGDARMEAVALNTAGSVRLLLGHAQDSHHTYGRALELAREAETRFNEIEALIGLARSARKLGRADTAWQRAQQAYDLARKGGYQVLEGQASTVLALVCLDQGRREEAGSHAHRALTSHRATGHCLGVARTLAVLARVAELSGDREAAGRHRQAARSTLLGMRLAVPQDLEV